MRKEQEMKKSIGILGGMGPLATADLFRKIVEMTDAESDRDHIRIYIDDHAQIPDRTAAILSGGEDPLPYMKESLRKLISCGADCIIMPCNTAHFFLPALQKESTVPFLSILEETAKAASVRFPGETAGLLATKGTLSAGLYQHAFEEQGLAYLTPDEEEQDALMRVIYDGVKAGAPTEQYREDMERVIAQMQENGASYFVLGCTELPIAADLLELRIQAVDPTAELARAAISYAGYSVKKA